MENPIQDLVESQITITGPRMPFFDQCGWFAALACGVHNRAVAVASGLAPPTVAFLKQAGQHYGGQTRYPKVAAEYAALGHDAFVHRCLAPKIRDRLAVAIRQIELKQLEPKTKDAIRPSAKAYQGRRRNRCPRRLKNGPCKIRFTPDNEFWAWKRKPGRGKKSTRAHAAWQGDETPPKPRIPHQPQRLADSRFDLLTKD